MCHKHRLVLTAVATISSVKANLWLPLSTCFVTHKALVLYAVCYCISKGCMFINYTEISLKFKYGSKYCISLFIHLEKAMAPHSSTVARKIPWTEEPGRLQSMGSLRVRHDWSDLAAAAAFIHQRFSGCFICVYWCAQGWGHKNDKDIVPAIKVCTPSDYHWMLPRLSWAKPIRSPE